MSKEYEVGYRRPPKEHRFQKGKSGNPRGRPRKKTPDPTPSLSEILKREGEQTVEINGEKITLIELEIRALHHKAAKGDIAASRHLAKLRAEAGLLKEKVTGTGVLLVPAPMSMD